MGFRFRKGIKLGKGLRLNLSKSGVSLSAGKPGASLNVGSRGASASVGIPGTGLSYRAGPTNGRAPRDGTAGDFTSSGSPGAVFGCLGATVVLAGLILLLNQAFTWGSILVGLAVLFFVLRSRATRRAAAVRAAEAESTRLREAERRADLTTRFGDATCSRILAGDIWVGQTEEQLREALGGPVDIDEKVMKTKKREVWKYDQSGVNRFNTRVTLENGAVTGWDRK